MITSIFGTRCTHCLRPAIATGHADGQIKLVFLQPCMVMMNANESATHAATTIWRFSSCSTVRVCDWRADGWRSRALKSVPVRLLRCASDFAHSDDSRSECVRAGRRGCEEEARREEERGSEGARERGGSERQQPSASWRHTAETAHHTQHLACKQKHAHRESRQAS